MKRYALVFVHVGFAFVVLAGACSNPVKSKLKGNWRSKDGVTKLNITDKEFTLDDGEAIAEDYFIKGDTIFTSFQGNQPYTKFIIEKMDEKYLKLMGPDSLATEYSR